MVQISEFVKMDSHSWGSIVLLVPLFLCLSPLCSGLPHGSRNLEEQHSHRLEKLRLLSKRLALNSRPERSSAPRHPPSDVGTLLVALKERTEYLQVRDQKRRAATVVKKSAGLDDFRDQYKTLHNELTTFVDLLVQRLKPGAPAGLQKITVLPKILTINDDGFGGSEDKKKMMVRKYFTMKEVLAEVIDRVGPQVVEEFQGWFNDKTQELQYYLFQSSMALVSVVLVGGQPDQVKVMSGGVGGLNQGLRQSLGSDNLKDLASLIEGLKELS